MTQYKRPERPTKRQLTAINNFYAAASPKAIAQVPMPKERARPVNWEHIEQVKVIKFWKDACAGYGLPEFSLFAVPNASRRSLHAGEAMRMEGLRRGAPDLMLAVPKTILVESGRPVSHGMPSASALYRHTPGLFIEMKRESGGIQSPEQINFEQYLNSAGYKYQLCHGAEAAIACIKQYLA